MTETLFTVNKKQLSIKEKMQTLGKLFEINLGCFGGADASIYKLAWKSSMSQFYNYLSNKEGGKLKANRIETFFENLDAAQPREAKDVFEKSIENIAKSIIENANDKEIFVVVTNKDYIDAEEEDYALAFEIGRQLAIKDNSTKKENQTDKEYENLIWKKAFSYAEKHAVSVLEYLRILEAKKKEIKNKDSKLDFGPEDTFIYDDFTPGELSNYLESQNKNNQYTAEEISKMSQSCERILSRASSLYPRNIERFTDKNFHESANLNIKRQTIPSKLIDIPVSSEHLTIEDIDNFKIDLTKKVLKIAEGGNSGEGVYFYKKDFNQNNPEENSKFFNEQKVKALLGKKKFVLEDYVTGPTTIQPIDLVKNPDGTTDAKYGKMKKFSVDTRFGYEYNPNTKTIKVISGYGRFAIPGEKNNVSQGGGVVEVKVVSDDKYEEAQNEMYDMVLSMSKLDGSKFHEIFKQNLRKLGFKNKGEAIPFGPLPYIICESAFNEMKKSAEFLAIEMQNKRELEGDMSKSKFIFALDAFVNPHPSFY